MRGDAHVRFGRRTGETGRWKQQHGAPVRSHERGQQYSQSTRSPRSKRSIAPPRRFPMLPTTPQRATHDYERNGTGRPFRRLGRRHAALSSPTSARPTTSADFVAFLNKINREVPAELDVHVILDNLSAHKAPTVHKMAAAPPPLPPPLHADIRILDEPRMG